jgi:hypothetical protein
MSQQALSIPSSPLTMATLKSTLEAIFAAINTVQSGALAPVSAVEPSLWIDTSGTPVYILKLYTTGGTALASAYALTLLDDADASTALSTLGVTNFAKTILDDANASAVLSTLGFSSFVKTLIAAADATAFKTLIEAIGIPNVSAGTTTTLGSASAERTETLTTSYVKKKEIKVGRNGTATVSFSIGGGTTAYPIYGRIYVNGLAVGTERTHSTTEYSSYSENIAIAQGDLVQLYLKANEKIYHKQWKDFYIKCTDPIVTLTMLDT